MALSFSSYLGGSGKRFTGDVGGLFFIYGAGFAAMSALVAGLFLEAHRDRDLTMRQRREALGEAMIWGICFATGLVSIILTQLAATRFWAAWAYATLPMTIGLAAWRFPWEPAE